MEHMVKVEFRLDKDAVGGPGGPVSETLWAEQVGDRRFRLRNVPFFAAGVSLHDVVFARQRRGRLVFAGVSLRGGHSTFWVAVKEGAEDRFPALWKELERIGCSYEGSSSGYYAVDVPPHAKLDDVYAVLEAGAAEDVWYFEEAHRGHA